MTSSKQTLIPLQKRWRIQPTIPDEISDALKGIHPLMRQLLYNRGIQTLESAEVFLSGTVRFSTDPFLLKGMDIVVERVHQAISGGQKIAIYGDYDADGVTSTALLVDFFKALGVTARAYIPNRFDEGYGLNEDAIRQLADENVDLMITVDCGVRSVKEVDLANALGLSVIITDHHQPGDVLPAALALINPQQKGDVYPEKDLAGVGLAYKLVQAYLSRYPQSGVDADDWLDLVAIGTVVDLAPLKGENRLLVRAGIDKLRRTPRQGIYSLAQAAGVNLDRCDATTLGFQLGPRLNAAGRLESALSALQLLTTEDIFEAGQLAQQLDTYNQERQDMTNDIRERAAAMVLEEDPEAQLFFAVDPEFNKGVVGLAASRLTELYYRPAIVGHRGETFTVASCRSIPEFHITRALDVCADLLVRHGGHAAAAGFTVRNEDLDELVARLREMAEDQLGDVDLIPVLDIDREIKLEHLNQKHISDIFSNLHQLEPTGRENPEPVFASFDVDVRYARCVGRDGSHLKLTLGAGRNTFDAIAFRQGHWMEAMPERVDIAYRFEINEFNGRSNLQLNIRDIRAAE
ncbi:MAG: single-stranded-DNA-specific exonuclease RecJ [Brevefilum sp.]|jgi:single-stranded-DNA-specific exonuclease